MFEQILRKQGDALQPSSDVLAHVPGVGSAAGGSGGGVAEMLSKGSADGGAPGPVSAAAEALGEMIAPPELTIDGANERDECSDEENAGAAGVALSEDSGTDEDSDAEDVFALSACEGSALENKYQSNFLYRWLQAVGELRG